MLPAVSVVITTYNQPEYLEKALESVFAQTFMSHEIIVVNDGSTDDTEARLGKFGDRIRVITQFNQGIGAARNRGLQAAAGRYVALLDHDDIWHPEKLALQHHFMQLHPEVVGCSVPFLYSCPQGKLGFDPKLRNASGIVENSLQRYSEGHLFLLSSIMMLDLAKVGDLRYETEKNSIEDVPLQIRLLLRGPYGIAGEKPLATYRVHASNSSRSANHLYRGIERLRSIERSGGFEPCTPEQRRAINALISALGRKMLIAQVTVGRRVRAIRGYITELPHQLRNRRFKFLCIFPALLAIPTRWLKRRFPVGD